jgi:hypothetical protein
MWILRIGSAEIPLQPHEVVAWVSEGRIRAEDTLRRQTENAWIRAKDVPELHDLFIPEAPIPHPVLEVATEKWALVKRFVRTKRAVSAGQPLFDLSSAELSAGNYQNAWRFNLTESALAAAPIVAVATVVDFLFDAREATLTAFGRAFEDVLSLLLPLSTPVFTFTFAVLASWSSFHRGEISKPRFWRAFRAFLYFDGTYGFFPKLLLVAGLLVGGKVLARRDDGFTETNVMLGLLAILMLTVGTLWEDNLLARTIPSKLFEANGYSPQVKPMLKSVNTNGLRYGPWMKYRLTARLLGTVAATFYYKTVEFVGSALAVVLERLRA